MYKHCFNGLVFFSNKNKIYKKNIILFFYGLGLTSNDFRNILIANQTKKQIIIPELPGHNGVKFKEYKDNILEFTKKIYLFIKKKQIDNVIYFSHSIGGIIPILLHKKFLKNRIKIKKFINYEGNLTEFDTKTSTLKTSSYTLKEFKSKFSKLVLLCQNSNKIEIKLWGKSIKKTYFKAFYYLSKDAVRYSKRSELLNFYRIFFKNKIYLFGGLSSQEIPLYFYGSSRLKIDGYGHFLFFENIFVFNKIFNTLVIKKNGR